MRHRHIVEILEARIAPAALFVWDGGGLDPAAGTYDYRWSTAANWVDDIAPTPGSALHFHLETSDFNTALFNDYPAGTPFESLHFSGAYVKLAGNEIVLSSGITGIGSYVSIDLPIKLAAPQAFVSDYGFGFAAIDFNGNDLRLEGRGDFGLHRNLIDTSDAGGAELLYAGTGRFIVSANGSAPATMRAQGPEISLYATLPQTTMILERTALSGSGETASLIARSSTIEGIYYSEGLQFTVNGEFTMDEASTLNAAFSPSYSPFPGLFDVAGSVTLGNAALNVRVYSQPRNGDQFEIVRNDGTDAVIGTFAGLPEGAIVTPLDLPLANSPEIIMGVNVRFRITYQGGDGNDVVLTADFPEVQVSEDGRIATFTDFDGDAVTIKTKFGRLDPRDFWLVRAGDVGGAQLARIDFESEPRPTDLTGTNFKITATPGEHGGDGRVNVGALEARLPSITYLLTGIWRHAVLGASSRNIPLAADQFTVQSLGAFGVTTQLPGLYSGSYLGFAGGVNELKVEDDVREASISGRFFGRISSGVIIGGAAEGSGGIHASRPLGWSRSGRSSRRTRTSLRFNCRGDRVRPQTVVWNQYCRDRRIARWRRSGRGRKHSGGLWFDR